MTNGEKICATCGAVQSADGADGLCFKCLGRLAFQADGRTVPGDGLRLGDYELLDEIARGGMGVVYRARQLSLNRIVALKVMLHGPFSSPDFVQRFHNEARMVAALSHSNIVSIYDVGEDRGNHFLALELVEGGSFADLARGRPLAAGRAANYVKLIAEAVEHAHCRGILHRDLKPSNILLDLNGLPKVTDFGLAKLITARADITGAGQVLGSPEFMAPEQAAGRAGEFSARSDIYSIGAILYQLLTGRPPFQGETLPAVLTQVMDAPPVRPARLNPQVPPDLETICLKCLRKEPSGRYASARELAEDLGCFIDNKPISARPVSSLEKIWLWRRRHAVPAALALVLLVVMLLGVAGICWEWRQAEAHARGEARARGRAQDEADRSRLNLYAADVAGAAHAITGGDLGLGRRILDRLRPQPGEEDLRCFAWYYLWRLCQGDQVATLSGHTGIVDCTAFSPDGLLLASGSHDGTVRIWDVARNKCVRLLRLGTNSIRSLTFSKKQLMVASSSKVSLLDIDSYSEQRSFPGGLAALSPDGSRLAIAQASPFFWLPAGPVKLFDCKTGRLILTLNRAGRTPAFSSNGQWLAVVGAESGIGVWDLAAQKWIRQWPTTKPGSIHFAPDSQHLVSTEWNSNATVWAMDPTEPARVITGHLMHVWSATYSPDGREIATTSSDETVRLWDARTLAPLSILRGHGSEVWCAAFSPDGRLLGTGGKDATVRLWDTAVSPTAHNLPHDSDFRPLFSPNGERLITVQAHTGASMLWDGEGKKLINPSLAGGRQVIGFSCDGKLVATVSPPKSKLFYWQPEGLNPIREVMLEQRGPPAAVYVWSGMSADGKFLFAITPEGEIEIWQTSDGRLKGEIKGPAAPIRNAVLSSDGKRLAVCVETEHWARLYNCQSGELIKLLRHQDFISGLAFSADGTKLATGSVDGNLGVWNAVTGEALALLPGHIQETTDVAFSPDGKTLASLGRGESLKLWHVATWREIYSLPMPDAAQHVVFSPDSQTLAVSTANEQLKLLLAPRN